MISVSQLVKQSVLLYTTHIKRFLPFLFLLFIPAAASIVLTTAAGMMIDESVETLQVVVYIIFILAFLCKLWFGIVLLDAIARIYLRLPMPKMKEMLRAHRTHLFSALFVSIFTTIAFIAGLFLFLIPAFIFLVWFFFSIYEVVFEQHPPIRAMKESYALVRGRFFLVLPRLIGSIAIFYLCYYLIGKFLGAGITALIPETISETTFLLVSSASGIVAHFIGLLIVIPSIAAPTILYFELKKK